LAALSTPVTMRPPGGLFYRQIDTCLGMGCLDEETVSVYMRVEPGPVPYRRRTARLALLHGHERGIYLRARPYIVLERATPHAGGTGPDATTTLRPLPAEQSKAHLEIGTVRAWFAVRERSLMLWECMLFPWCRQDDWRDDALLHTLWIGCEQELTRCTPGVERILTPDRQVHYSPPTWQAFLHERGYEALPGGTWAKDLTCDS